MKTLIICESIHHGNTEKIAKAMAEVLDATIKKPADVKRKDIAEADLVGLGSGIYMWKHHRSLFEMLDRLPVFSRQAFIFSTSGGPGGPSYHAALKEKMGKRGLRAIAEFNCKGWDTVGPLAIVGGINKGKPDDNDIFEAKIFAEGLKRRLGATLSKKKDIKKQPPKTERPFSKWAMG
jgi:flavodoxin